MEHSQLYIGTENGVVVCVDRTGHGQLSGRYYHSYSTAAHEFLHLEDLLFKMEELFNQLVFPHPSTNERYFTTERSSAHAQAASNGSISNNSTTRPYRSDTEKRERIMKDEELLMQHGDLGSFIIRVQHRQNSSWQGRITWMEKNQTVYFRSVWEMMKLIENAIDSVSPQEEEDAEPSWTALS